MEMRLFGAQEKLAVVVQQRLGALQDGGEVSLHEVADYLRRATKLSREGVQRLGADLLTDV